MRLLHNKYKSQTYLAHSDTSWWYMNIGNPSYYQYFKETDGWKPKASDTEGAALVAPHHLLTWED